MSVEYYYGDRIILRVRALRLIGEWENSLNRDHVGILYNLLGYADMGAMRDGWCDKDVEALKRLTGPNGYFYYRAWKARNVDNEV